MNVGERLASPEDPEDPENKDNEDADVMIDNILPLVGRTKRLFDADIASARRRSATSSTTAASW